MKTLKELNFPNIIFGGNVFGWTLNEKESFKILDELMELGLNAIDTADMYSTWVEGNSGGDSETIIGKWMKERKNRDKVLLTTKVGMEFRGNKGLKKDYILNAIDGSLERLQTDYIDVYMSHQEDLETPIEETLSAFQEILDSSKAKTIGASNYSLTGLADALRIAEEKKLPKYQVYQPQYNMYDRAGFEDGFSNLCLDNNVDVVTYYSLASGFLSGKYRTKEDASKSQRGSMVVGSYLNERGLALLSAMDEIAKTKQTSLTSIAIAWLMHQDSVYAPIVSATKQSHLKEIIQAKKISLTSDELQCLTL